MASNDDVVEPSDGGASYPVGYARSPRHSQFKKGRSGNNAGRPKGSLNLATHIAKEMNAKVTIQENGGRKRISKKHAVAKQLVNKAASGDPKAISLLLSGERQRDEVVEAAGRDDQKLTQTEDRRVMESMLRRIRQSAADVDQSSTEENPDQNAEANNPAKGTSKS